jgi:hypothetical protein
MDNNTLAANAQDPPKVYCDWRLEIYDCELSQMWILQVSISLITFVILSITGTFIFGYRYKYMWKGLFVDHGNGIRPLPVDNLLFFWTISCYLKALHEILMLTRAYSRYWQKEFMHEIGWTALCYGGILYLIGKFYFI